MLPNPVTTEEQRLLRMLAYIASFIAALALITGMYWGQAILIPFAMAILFSFLLKPVVDLFQRCRLGRIMSVILVVVITGVVCASIGWVVMTQVSTLVEDMGHHPQYKTNIKEKMTAIQSLSKSGLLDDVQTLINEVLAAFEQGNPAAETPVPPPIVVQDQSSPFTTIQGILTPLLEPLSAAALIVVLVIFMLLQYEDGRNRLIGLVGASQLTVTTRAIDDAAQRISRYLLMQLIINGSYGVALCLGLWLLGVPYPVLWGFLAAVCRYIPYVGPLIAAAFPILISLVAFPGWLHPLLVVGLVLVLELWSNLLMEPWLYGQSSGVSPVGLLVATGFWTWLWGPIGLVLATPLTVCLVVLGRYVPYLSFFDTLFGDAPTLAPAVIYYQRLLARDQEEAMELVETYVKERDADRVYDELLIPALLLAWQDRKQGILSVDSEASLLQATREIVADLGAITGESSPDEEESSPDELATKNAMEAPMQAPALILGCPAHHEAEEVLLQMLQQLMRPTGYQVDVVSTRIHAADIVARIQQKPPALLFLAALPGALPQTRYLCRHLHTAFPALPIVVGYWGGAEEFDKVFVRLRQAGASALTTSLQQSRSRISALAEQAVPPTVTGHPVASASGA